MVIGIVAFSFGLREKEPNPCNVRLAEEVIRIKQGLGDDCVIVAQWEVCLALGDLGVSGVYPIWPNPGEYLDTKEVARQASEIFLTHGVSEVVAVANPFLHLGRCRKFMKKSFKVREVPVRPIGFDPESTQWWTRGPVHFLLGRSAARLIGR